MIFLTILNFLLYICILQNTANCQNSLTATDETPFEALCSRKCVSAENENATEDFPLYICSCSPSCTTYGDCCYDSDHRNATTWVKMDFICLSLVDRGRYKAVSGCPADQLSDFCKAGIGHLPPVTSKVTNTTYANVFCATCNGDGENLATWNVELRCLDKEKGFAITANDTTRIVYHGGYLWRFSDSRQYKSLCMYHVHYDNFRLIDSLELRFCDSGKKFSDCSPSWTESTTIEMCRSYENPVYFGSRVFRNSHCAECNYMAPRFAQCLPFNMEIMLRMGLYDSSVDQFCRQRGSDACLKYLGRGRPYSFANLLNINEVACVPDPGERCCPGEKYDFRSKRCRKVSQG